MTASVTREQLLGRIRDLRAGGRFSSLSTAGAGRARRLWPGGWPKNWTPSSFAPTTSPAPACPQWDWPRFAEQVLTPLLEGRKARYQRYGWDEDALAEWHEIEPGGIMIAEGVSISRTELGDPWDLKGWVDCPYDRRLARGLDRDGEVMRDTWMTVWIPEEDHCVAEQRPQERADYVVLGYEPD